jgi:uncharacterized protein YndB with AHSA1/START domain
MVVTIRESLKLPLPPERVFDFLSSEEGFLSFAGAGIVPGLAEVRFDHGGFRVAGSKARVTNTDGSTHREEIRRVDRPHGYAVRIDQLSSPFRFLVRHVDEVWTLTPDGTGTALDRAFVFTLRSRVALPVALPLGHVLFRFAMRRHHDILRAWAERTSEAPVRAPADTRESV